MANWVFVKDRMFSIPLNSTYYSRTPDQYYQDEYMLLTVKGYSVREAKRIAEELAQRYQADREAEQRKNRYLSRQPALSYYINTNSIERNRDSIVGILENTFHAQVKITFSPLGQNALIAYLREKNKPVPAGLEKLSFIVETVHFKSPDGITKYYAISDRVAFTSNGAQIAELALSNAPLNWTFIKPDDDFEAIFDAAYNRL